MKKYAQFLFLFAVVILCSCDNKEKQLDEALSKAVACAELGHNQVLD